MLVVEDDAPICAAIAWIVRSRGAEAIETHSVAAAAPALRTPVDLIVLDVRLPDGDAFTVLQQVARVRPTPKVVAVSGQATPEETFRLCELGVSSFVPKPFTQLALLGGLDGALDKAPDIRTHAVASVGLRSLQSVRSDVRESMIDEALARANGNRSRAGRILDISRQAVQQIVRGREEAGGDQGEEPGETEGGG